MNQYLDLLSNVMCNGTPSDDRTGTGTIATFGEQIKFDLREGFPAVTTKRLAWKSVVSELLWFLKGSNDLFELRALLHGEEHRYNADKKTIWDANYYEQGTKLGYSGGYMGDIYGCQWRQFNEGYVSNTSTEHGDEYLKGVDQIKNVLEEAQKNPNSRRLLVTAWNPYAVWPEDNSHNMIVDYPVLPPCHYGFQINIQGEFIDLLWTQRSTDLGLGLPFNIASYALLCHIFGKILDKTPRFLIGQLGNTHIYSNHIDMVKEQLTRESLPLPELLIKRDFKTLGDFTTKARVSDFELFNYRHHAVLTAPMAV